MGGAGGLRKATEWLGGVSADWGKGFQDITGHTARKAAEKAAAAQTAAAEKQTAMLEEQEATLATKEKERFARIKKKRQGRRSLLYKGGDEAGVLADTLG
jgi:hypothetical protein